MNHEKIIQRFASTEACCNVQHCIHKKCVACGDGDDVDDDLNTRFCLKCISGIFHESLAETEQKRQEKRGKISEGHQFLPTGFADGTLFQYEHVNTGEKFFYSQEPYRDEIVQETGHKWLKAQQNWSTNCSTTPLCAKGDEFKDPKQKTLDDYVTKTK